MDKSASTKNVLLAVSQNFTLFGIKLAYTPIKQNIYEYHLT